MADAQLARKVDSIAAVAAEVVVASNPGCAMHLARGAAERGLAVRIVHLVELLARAITAALYPIVHTVYRVPFLNFLPYYDYFGNFRRLTFERNTLNVFDKLNAPQTKFTTYAKCRTWFNARDFVAESISILPYKGVSWSLSGTVR